MGQPETAGARSERDFYPEPIELSGLSRGVMNRRRLDADIEAVVILRGEELSIIRDLCPHMGGPLSEGEFRAEEGELECPWHGYCYKAEDGSFLRNPNDAIFEKLKGCWQSYKPEKMPKYRLQLFSYEIRDGKAYVRRPGAA